MAIHVKCTLFTSVTANRNGILAMKTVWHEILLRLQGLSCLKFMAAALFTMVELHSTQKEVLFLLEHFKPKQKKILL